MLRGGFLFQLVLRIVSRFDHKIVKLSYGGILGMI